VISIVDRAMRTDEIVAVGNNSDAETCSGEFGFLLTDVNLLLSQALAPRRARPQTTAI
jgi:hypothetical protein